MGQYEQMIGGFPKDSYMEASSANIVPNTLHPFNISQHSKIYLDCLKFVNIFLNNLLIGAYISRVTVIRQSVVKVPADVAEKVSKPHW